MRSVTAAQLRALATHLVERGCAPSFDGYTLAAGLDAAADLLDGLDGPWVYDSDQMKDIRLAGLLATLCTCGHTRNDHPDDGACIHGGGDDGCIQYQPSPQQGQSSKP